MIEDIGFDFDINKVVRETLLPLDIPVFFGARKECPLPCVIFTINNESADTFWEDEEAVTKYKVTINIFSRGNYIQYKKQVKKLMEGNGFIRTSIPEVIYQEDVEIFNQPMFFSFYQENY